MIFETDRQTYSDLELYPGSRDEKSVFSLFNNTKSVGGRKKLEKLFKNPLTCIDPIKSRINLIRFLNSDSFDFRIDKEWLDFIEFYLSQDDPPDKNSFISLINWLLKHLKTQKNKFYIIKRGIRNLLVFINEIHEFAHNMDSENTPELWNDYKKEIIELIEQSELKKALHKNDKKKFGALYLKKFDYIFRSKEKVRISRLLDIIYELDAFKSVSDAAVIHSFSFPEFTENGNSTLEIRGLFHPFLESPVQNDIEFTQKRNILFLTGPNMAGKSTFIKAIGISVYLSHIGFPVPAVRMETSLFNGLFSTINLFDDLNKGYSHFYNEVLRIKEVAEKMNSKKRFVILFDELFRGTNVKDAFDASLSVLLAFSKINYNIFAVSTHISEIAKELKHLQNMNFRFFEIKSVENMPAYTYRLKKGVTGERLGMYIVNREKLLETIEKAKNIE
jgi:DNA mismatch repair protein MutS